MLLKDWVAVRVWGLAVVGILSLFVPMKASAVAAAPVKLSWAASTDTAVAGYAVYYGPVGSGNASRLDAGANLQAVIPNLTADADYTFRVVAYDFDGAESPPSNQVQYSPPALTRVQLSQYLAGMMKLQFRGPAGAYCRVEYATSLNPPNWQTLGGAYASATDGTVTVLDAAARTSPMRFYRAVYP